MFIAALVVTFSYVFGLLIFFDAGLGDIALILGAAAIGAYSLAFMQKRNGVLQFTSISVSSFWYISYLLTIFLPGLYVFLVADDEYRFKYLFAVTSVLLTMPLGIDLANRKSRFAPDEVAQFHLKPVQVGWNDRSTVPAFAFVFGVALFFSAMYIVEVQTIPLFYMLTHPGEAGQLAQLRDESMKLLDSNFRFVYHLVRDMLYPVLVLFSFGQMLLKRTAVWKGIFAVCFFLAFLFASFSTARLPAASILLMLGVFFCLYHGGRLSASTYLIIGLIFLAFPSAVMLVSENHTDVAMVMQRLGYRIFISPADTLYYYFVLIPDVIDYLYGRGMGSLCKLVGVEYFDMGHFVAMYHSPTGGHGYGSANAAFISGLYSDFGISGMLFGSVFTGFCMQLTNIRLCRRPKTVWNLACFGFLIFTFAQLNILPIPSVLVFSGLPILVGIWMLERTGRRKADGVGAAA
ncbi:MAG: hypothetical protein AAB268_11305 [Elusimicrobiota bacterium]